jgi:hypothetical protein
MKVILFTFTILASKYAVNAQDNNQNNTTDSAPVLSIDDVNAIVNGAETAKEGCQNQECSLAIDEISGAVNHFNGRGGYDFDGFTRKIVGFCNGRNFRQPPCQSSIASYGRMFQNGYLGGNLCDPVSFKFLFLLKAVKI